MTNKETIERLKWVQKRISDITYSPESFEAINLAIKALDERPQGKWDEICEPFGWSAYVLSARCSACGESYPYPEDEGFNDIVEMFKYCPNCGAKMEAGSRWKEEEDEE